MDIRRLDRSTLERCSEFTTLSLLLSSAFLMLLMCGQLLRTGNNQHCHGQVHQKWHTTADATAQAVSNMSCDRSVEPRFLPSHIVGQVARFDATQPVEAVMNSSDLSVDTIKLNRVVKHEPGVKNRLISIYLANCSNQSGLVQLRTDFSVPPDSNKRSSQNSNLWTDRRMPMLDDLEYNVTIPKSKDLSAVIVSLRLEPGGTVRQFKLPLNRMPGIDEVRHIDESYAVMNEL